VARADAAAGWSAELAADGGWPQQRRQRLGSVDGCEEKGCFT